MSVVMAIRALAVAGVFLGPLVAVIGLVKFLNVLARNEVARLPVVPEQKVTVPAPGSYILALEGPQFTWIGAIRYAMLDPRGAQVESFSGIGGMRSSGFTRARSTVRRFLLRNGGTHTLVVTGAPQDASELTLILSKALTTGEMLWVVAMVIATVVFVGSLFLVIVG